MAFQCGNMSLMIIIPIFVKNKLKCFTRYDVVIDSIHYLLQNYNGKKSRNDTDVVDAFLIRLMY